MPFKVLKPLTSVWEYIDFFMFALLKNKGIVFLGLSNTISQLGDRLTHMVIITIIGAMFPGRISAFSEFCATFTLPVIILSPFAGVLIDHWNKRTIMFRCHLIQSILIILTPSFIIFTKSIIPIWILVVIFFSLDLFNNASKNVVIPDLVNFDELVGANSLIITMARIATFVGMVGGGYLVRIAGWQGGFYIDAATHLTAGILVLFMGAKILFEPVKRLQFSLKTELKKSFNQFVGDLKELILVLSKDRVVIFVMLSVCILPFASAVAYTVMVYLVQQEFRLGTEGVGVLGGVIGIGMLIGGVLMGMFGNKFSRGKIIIFSMLILTVIFIVGPSFITPLILYVMSLISGMVFSAIGISQDTMLQEDVLKEIRGRIFATKEFIVNVTFLSSAGLVGVVSSSLKPYTIIFGTGICLFLIALCSIFIFRAIPKEIRAKF